MSTKLCYYLFSDLLWDYHPTTIPRLNITLGFVHIKQQVVYGNINEKKNGPSGWLSSLFYVQFKKLFTIGNFFCHFIAFPSSFATSHSRSIGLSLLCSAPILLRGWTPLRFVPSDFRRNCSNGPVRPSNLPTWSYLYDAQNVGSSLDSVCWSVPFFGQWFFSPHCITLTAFSSTCCIHFHPPQFPSFLLVSHF